MAKKPRNGQRAKAPITRHPLFPAIVALWFAALLGLGSLAIRPGLFESIVLSTHIDLLIPAAAPPLGVTARIVVALALAVGGGMLGAVIARRIAQPKIETRPLRRGRAMMRDALGAGEAQDAGQVRRPFSAHEELGESTIAAEDRGIARGNRRRSLAITEEDDEFRMFETAPLPGGQPPVFDAARIEPATEQKREPEALDLASFEPLPSAQPAAPAFAEAPVDFPSRQVFQPSEAPQADPQPDTQAGYAAFAPPAAQPIDFSRPSEVVPSVVGAPQINLSFGEPVQSSAPAAPAAVEQPLPKVAPEPTSESASPATPTTTDAVVAALDELGLIELTERFAQTLRRRREKLSGAVVAEQAIPEPAAEPEQAPLTFEPLRAELAAPEPVAENPAAETAIAPASAPQLPASMRPIDFGAFDDEDDDLSSLLPLRNFAPPSADVPEAPAAAMPEEFTVQAEPDTVHATAEQSDAETGAKSEAAIEVQGYSSLLDLVKQPEQAPQFVRIEESDPASDAIEPVVIFPGQAASLRLGQAPAQPAPLTAPAAACEAPVAAPASPAQFEGPAPEPVTLRPFDSPSVALPGQAVAAAPTQVQDPAETERALRAALATLQRMSGAA